MNFSCKCGMTLIERQQYTDTNARKSFNGMTTQVDNLQYRNNGNIA